MLRQALVVALAAGGVGLSAPAVFADDWFGQVECGEAGGPGCDLSAGHRDSSGRPSDRPPSDEAGPDGEAGGSGGGGEPRCRFEKAEGAAKRRDLLPPEGKKRADGGEWYWRICRTPSGDDVSERVWLEPGEDGEPAVDPRILAEMARSRLRLPEPEVRMSPPVDELHLVRRLPTWMWLEPDSWGRRSASAEVPGIEVTATAAAARARWVMGDGDTETCDGPGTRFDPSRYGGDQESPDCGHRYLVSSAGQPDDAYRVRVRVVWPVTWSGGGESGVLPPLVTTQTVRVRVGEAHGLIQRHD